MRKFAELKKLQIGDKVAIVSPSYGAPAAWPEVYSLGISRLRDLFQLEPIEFPTTRQIAASVEDRAADLVAAFSDPDIKAVISSIGGDDQVTYVQNLPREVFVMNPKPFFGFSDNTHFVNFLWLNGIPSYYGGSLFTQYAMQGAMDGYTVDYLRRALFEKGEFNIHASSTYCEEGLDWSDLSLLNVRRKHEPNPGFVWDGVAAATGITWGGCIESIDEMLRHGMEIPSLEDFKEIILMLETSEEVPSAAYVHRVLRALGERGILKNIRGVLIGRAKAWEFDKQLQKVERDLYRQEQQRTITDTTRQYNPQIPLVFNLNFGHTDPQIAVPYGKKATINPTDKLITFEF